MSETDASIIQRLDPWFTDGAYMELEVVHVDGAEPVAGYLADHDWLSVAVEGARLLFRWRGRYPNGHWSGWHWVYSAEYVQVPEAFR